MIIGLPRAMANSTRDNNSLLIQVSREYEASLDGITNSPSHVLSDVEGQEEQYNYSEVRHSWG